MRETLKTSAASPVLTPENTVFYLRGDEGDASFFKEEIEKIKEREEGNRERDERKESGGSFNPRPLRPPRPPRVHRGTQPGDVAKSHNPPLWVLLELFFGRPELIHFDPPAHRKQALDMTFRDATEKNCLSKK